MNRYLLVAILVAVWGLSAGAAALQQQQQKPLNVRAIQKIRDNLYFISGGELNERATSTIEFPPVQGIATRVVEVRGY